MAGAMTAQAQRRLALRPLFAYMEQWGIKRTWLADRLGVSKQVMWTYEHGVSAPRDMEGFQTDACRALGITPERLGWESRPRPRGRVATRKAS